MQTYVIVVTVAFFINTLLCLKEEGRDFDLPSAALSAAFTVAGLFVLL